MISSKAWFVALLWFVAMLVIGAAYTAPMVWSRSSRPAAIHDCRAIDGDTIICGGEHIRLIGVDAPEMPGHCRKGRHCAPGDPFASKRLLEALLSAGPLMIEREQADRYGRTLAHVRVAGRDVACGLLAGSAAVYRRDWDDLPRGQVARECGL